MKAANTLSFHYCTALNGCVLRVALIRFAVLQSVWPISQPLATCKTLPSKMLSATLRRTARVALSHRSGSSARSNTLTLVAVNDVYDLEHLPKLRTLVDAVKVKREGGHVITTLAGDFLSPSVLSSLDRGRGMVQVLNAVGIDYACLGNHEADGGLKALAKRIGELDATLVNSNVPGIAAPATALVELPGGKRVGVLGLLTSERGVFRKDVRMQRLGVDGVKAEEQSRSPVLSTRRSSGGSKSRTCSPPRKSFPPSSAPPAPRRSSP